MKFTINKNIFSEALKNINNLVSNNMNPRLTSVHIKTENNQLYLIATNGISSYQQIINEVTIEKDGDILVNANLLYRYVSQFSQNELTLNQIDENILQIKTDKSSSEINLTDNYSFPIIKFDYEGWKKITLSFDTLKNIQERVKPFVSNVSQNQYNITNGIYFNAIDDKQMECVASDMFMASYYKFDYEGSPIKFVIGTEAIDYAISISSSRKNKTVDFYLDNKNCILKIDNTLMSFSLYDNTYPNITKTLLEPQKYSFTVKLDELNNSLNRGSVFVSKEKRPIANLKIENNKLNIKFTSSETGNSFEEMELVNCNTEQFEAKFNQKLLSDLLHTIKSPTVTFNFNRSNVAIIITSENPYFINVIMPIRSI